MDKIYVSIGGGDLRTKTTLKIDSYVAALAKKHAQGKRAYGLFIGTASHDFMPYFNTFRKTFTGEFDIKADCALTVYGEMSYEKIAAKFEKADFLYIGGGDTVFMLDTWKKTGLYDLVLNAYERGVIVSGLSAGGICFFETMYTDSSFVTGGDSYSFYPGMNVIKGTMCPHYDDRKPDFNAALLNSEINSSYAVEADSALVFKNGELVGSLSSGGKSYILRKNLGTIETFEISPISE
ncbi:MAG: Type 1 glutamine amidotransferase-like domain-containing protein [Clostridia bacterium]|nr:Type 1 glutamine amidotransferase-like domain-containing protein [Clostridia bacterium]